MIVIVIVIVIVSGDWAAICGRVALLLIPFVLGLWFMYVVGLRGSQSKFEEKLPGTNSYGFLRCQETSRKMVRQAVSTY